MRKIIALLLCLVFLVSLVGCGLKLNTRSINKEADLKETNPANGYQLSIYHSLVAVAGTNASINLDLILKDADGNLLNSQKGTLSNDGKFLERQIEKIEWFDDRVEVRVSQTDDYTDYIYVLEYEPEPEKEVTKEKAWWQFW